MKAQDLMLGDWVLYENEVWKVTQLSEGAIGIANKKRWWLAASVEGVPITPEILEKNGFKNINDYFVQHIDKWIVHIENTFTKMNLAIWKDKSIGCAIDIPVYYVHELQHALRSCGINKEIIL